MRRWILIFQKALLRVELGRIFYVVSRVMSRIESVVLGILIVVLEIDGWRVVRRWPSRSGSSRQVSVPHLMHRLRYLTVGAILWEVALHPERVDESVRRRRRRRYLLPPVSLRASQVRAVPSCKTEVGLFSGSGWTVDNPQCSADNGLRGTTVSVNYARVMSVPEFSFLFNHYYRSYRVLPPPPAGHRPPTLRIQREEVVKCAINHGRK